VSSETVGDSFLKVDAEGAVQMNIRAISVAKQKYKIVSFSHSEGLSDWHSDPIQCSNTIVITQKTNLKNIITVARKQHEDNN